MTSSLRHGVFAAVRFSNRKDSVHCATLKINLKKKVVRGGTRVVRGGYEGVIGFRAIY